MWGGGGNRQGYGPGQGGGQPVLLPPGPGMLQGGGGGGGVAYPQQGMGMGMGPGGGMGGYGPPPGMPAGGPAFGGGWQQQQQQRPGMPPGGGYGYAPPGMPGGGYAQGGPPGQGGYSSGGRMQGIAGPNVRSLGTVASAAPPKMHLFQKTLRDMITGMRQHKNPADQQRFLHKCMAEMRDEVRHGTQLARLSGSAASQPPRARRARRPRLWRCGCRLPRRVRPSGATLSRPPFRGLAPGEVDGLAHQSAGAGEDGVPAHAGLRHVVGRLPCRGGACRRSAAQRAQQP